MSKKSFIPIPPPAPIPEPEEIDPAWIKDQFDSGEIDLVCVMGPTASGKTRYAVNLARRINELYGAPKAEIISADSRQVYVGMDLGTGKDLSEYGEIPYHLIDIVPAGYKYNICQYQRDFSEVFKDCQARGVFPILCGGSGLYIESVTRETYAFEENKGVELFLPRKVFFMATVVDRDTRRARIDARLVQRLDDGMFMEIKRLIASGVTPEDLIYYGLEYRYLTMYALGQMTCDEMFSKLQIAIHQFAKRQMTWLRGMENDGIVIHWVKP